MPDVLYPAGYATTMVTLSRLQALHLNHMHPEFARRLFPWIEAQRGRIGIGGGHRITQPVKPGFAPAGKSFHQSQRFASGIDAYCAVDLVHINPGQVHRSPTWAEVPAQGSAWALSELVHCNVNGEPWHMQPIEIDGFDSWVAAGRRDPVPPPPPPPDKPPVLLPESEEDELITAIVKMSNSDAEFACSSAGFKFYLPSIHARSKVQNLAALSGRTLDVQSFTDLTWFEALGPVVGPIPQGHDAYGIKR